LPNSEESARATQLVRAAQERIGAGDLQNASYKNNTNRILICIKFARPPVTRLTNCCWPMHSRERLEVAISALERTQGRTREARELLQSVYDRFTEGFESSDLKRAKQLLDELKAAPEQQAGAARARARVSYRVAGDS
jgi:hypothetical protein